jgi:hypothetical protein
LGKRNSKQSVVGKKLFIHDEFCGKNFLAMRDEATNLKIVTKREFLRQCAFCTGGLALGAYKSNCSSYLHTEEESAIAEGKATNP